MKYEIKKNLFSGLILFFLIACTFLDVYKIYEYYDLNPPATRAFGKEALLNTFEKYGGRITSEKAEFVTNFTLTAQSAVISGNYDKSNNTDKYITGSYFLDYQMFSMQFYSPMKYNYGYKEYADGIAAKAEENVTFFTERRNLYEVAINRQIADTYSGRYISEVYYNEAYNFYFNYEFSNLMMCFMLIIGIAPIFVSEKSIKMQSLLYSCVNGKNKVFFSKVVTILVYTLFIFVWFTAVDLISFGRLYLFDGGESPIYSLVMFKNIPINCTTLQFLAITLFYRFVGCLVLSSIIMLGSVVFSQPSLSGLFGIVVLMLLMFSDSFGLSLIANISPVRIMSSSRLFSEYQAFNLFDHPIPVYIAVLICNLIVSLILFLVCWLIYAAPRKSFSLFYSKRRLNRAAL